MRLIYSWRHCSIIFFGTPIRRKVRSQTSDIWTDVATVVRAVREEKESEERRSKCAKRSKCGKTLFFQCFVAPEGRKVGSLKRRSHLGRWEMNNCTRLWHRADLEVKTLKTSWARREAEHFWKSRCSKSARRCGAKHILMSKVWKTDGLGPLLYVQTSKKRATL